MTTASSHGEREGAVCNQAGRARDAAPASLGTIVPRRQGIDYGEDSDVVQLHPSVVLDRNTVTIVSGPISLWKLAFWGVVLFLIGFFDGRELGNLGTSAVEAPITQTSTAATSAPPSPSLAPAPSQPTTAAASARVVVKLLKYSPETIEIRKGETVEWTNSDLTPHTVTSQNGGELGSGSIEAGTSWRHTFTEAGSFPYFCTFHPEMKATIVVK